MPDMPENSLVSHPRILILLTDWAMSLFPSVVLVVDPQTKTIRDYRSAEKILVYEDGSIDLGEALPGFRLDVSELLS